MILLWLLAWWLADTPAVTHGWLVSLIVSIVFL